MRYKVIHEKVCVTGFETAQGAGDYLFTIPAEKISEFYIHDTKENAAEACISYLNEKIRTGEYKKAMKKVEKLKKEHDKKVRMSQR